MKSPCKKNQLRDEAVDATAAAWLAERDDGLTPEAAAEFARWRQADPRHEAAVALLESAWGALQQLQSFRPEARMHPDRDLLARPAEARRLLCPAAVAAFALAAALALVSVWWSHRPPAAPAPANTQQAFATADGGYERTTLPDGSTIELNSGSELRVHFTPGERRIRLVRGEAHFLVAKNKARPFWVEAGPVCVRAVGTEFDVAFRPTSVEVLVTEGRVQVYRLAAAAPAAPAATPQTMAILGASQRASVSLQGMAVKPFVENVNSSTLQAELSWHGPRLEFTDTPLAEVVRQFNQCNHVQLELGDPALGAETVGGSFQAENVEAFVRLLASGRDIVAERPDAGHIILRKAP